MVPMSTISLLLREADRTTPLHSCHWCRLPKFPTTDGVSYFLQSAEAGITEVERILRFRVGAAATFCCSVLRFMVLSKSAPPCCIDSLSEVSFVKVGPVKSYYCLLISAAPNAIKRKHVPKEWQLPAA